MQGLKHKKIIFITPKESEFVKGGIASWTSKLLKYGLPEGYSFRVIDSSVSLERGIFNLTQYNFFLESSRALKILFYLFYQLLIFRPKVLHLNSSISKYGIFRDLLCLVLAKSFGLETFVHFRGNLPQPWQKDNTLSAKTLDRLIQVADGVIAINNPSILFLEELVESNKIFKLESFIENDIFIKKREYKKENQDLKVLFIGAFVEEKGANEILTLADIFPNLSFNLVGQISENYQNQISNKINIKSNGIVSRIKILEFLDENDIFLFPSHSEGFPNVVLEAMSRGLPIIASNVGAIPEMIIDQKGGYLSDIEDIESLKISLDKLLSNNVAREEMGKFNYYRARELYTYDVIIKKMIKIYET